MCPRRPHLVLFLSNEATDSENSRSFIQDDGRLHYRPKAGTDRVFTFDESITKSLDSLSAIENQHRVRWRWEMPLRGIAYQVGQQDSSTLSTVTLVCSKESLPQAHLFAEVMREFLCKTAPAPKLQVLLRDGSGGVRIEPLDAGATPKYDAESSWDFEDFNGLIEGLYGLIAAMGEQGIAENQIIIDVTGGQKTTSIAGASITINREVVIQYIQTNNKHEPRGYDVIHPTGETPGFGT